MSRRVGRALAVFALLVPLIIGFAAWISVRKGPRQAGAQPADASTIARGAYLARAGNCAGCYTARGGAAYAGGPGVETPFGTVHASNLTPDDATGLGRWSASQFWNAMHHGRSRDGRLLYPAFPYPSFTHVSREDSDAIHAFLRSLPPVRQANKPHDLRFPYNLQASLAVWRALYFRPGEPPPVAGPSDAAARGRYLVDGLGHCAACHSARNALGATARGEELRGGLMPLQDWYAPSLLSTAEGGVQGWRVEDVVDLLKTGTSAAGKASGRRPRWCMAARSTSMRRI